MDHGSHLTGLASGRGRPPLLLAQPLQRLVCHLHFAEAQLVELALGFVGYLIRMERERHLPVRLPDLGEGGAPRDAERLARAPLAGRIERVPRAYRRPPQPMMRNALAEGTELLGDWGLGMWAWARTSASSMRLWTAWAAGTHRTCSYDQYEPYI